MEREANWLASYAVGLVWADVRGHEATRRLHAAARARPELLDQARARVAALTTGDPTVVARAAALLAAAAGSLAVMT